jgi:hypothetical protein
VVVGQSNDCIRGDVNLFDEIGVEKKRFTVQTRKLDHLIRLIESTPKATFVLLKSKVSGRWAKIQNAGDTCREGSLTGAGTQRFAQLLPPPLNAPQEIGATAFDLFDSFELTRHYIT